MVEQLTPQLTHIRHRRHAKLKLLIFAIIGTLLGACALGAERTLEAKDVVFFKTVEVSSSPLVELKITGLSGHSALVVSDVTKIVDGDSLTVLVHLALTRSGLSGRFTYDINLPPEVNVVYFGEEKAVIWKRGIGTSSK
jgi:hypothetical protein